MSVIDFPPPPQPLGTIYAQGAASWRWDGTKWVAATGTTGTLLTVTVSQILPPGFSGTVLVEAAAPLAVSLPLDPTAGQVVTVKDAAGNAETHTITISGNGELIQGSPSLLIQYNYDWASLMYSGSQWVQT